MPEVQWGLAAQNNPLNYFAFGQQMGTQARERQDRQERQNALAAYATNPDDPNALAGVIKVDPATGMQLRGDQEKRAEAGLRRDLTGRAMRGDDDALLQLYGIDPETAGRLDDKQKAAATDGIKYISDAAYQIVQLPENERAAAWDRFVDQGASQFPGIAQYRGKYSPEALNSIVAQAGNMRQFQEFQQPDYTPVGEGGLAGFQYGRPIQDGAGQPRDFGPPSATPAVQEGATATNPATGEKIQFRGGQWVPMGGAAPTAPTPFDQAFRAGV